MSSGLSKLYLSLATIQICKYIRPCSYIICHLLHLYLLLLFFPKITQFQHGVSPVNANYTSAVVVFLFLDVHYSINWALQLAIFVACLHVKETKVCFLDIATHSRHDLVLVHCPPGSPHPAHITSSLSPHSLSSPITSSTIHSRLKTHLFHKSFPP